LLFTQMKQEVFTTGCVDYEFEIYVSETNKVTVWIEDGLCLACMVQSGSVCQMLKPYKLKANDVVKDVAHKAAIAIIEDYFDEDVAVQISLQTKDT
jgi:hypothetical protein